MRSPSALFAMAVGLTVALASCAPPPPPTPREQMIERVQQRRAAMAAAANAPVAANPDVPASLSTMSRSPAVPQRVDITVDGQQRHFFVVAPASVGRNAPVVMLLHGGGGNAERSMESNSLASYADREDFIAVFPDGNRLWNDGRLKTTGGADDVKFLRMVVDWLVQNKGADPGRVFATGISSGGMMAAKLACDAPDLVAAIAPVAANFTESTYAACRPSSSTPVVMFSGTRDPLMLFEGGRPDTSRLPGRSDGPLETLVSAMKSAELWARFAGCSGYRTTSLPNIADDGTSVTRIDFDCAQDQVTLYRIDGGGHTWPGGRSSERLARVVGSTSRDIDATALMLDFFKRYGL